MNVHAYRVSVQGGQVQFYESRYALIKNKACYKQAQQATQSTLDRMFHFELQLISYGLGKGLHLNYI